MKYSNDFIGKKLLVQDLSDVYRECKDFDIEYIELKKYKKGNMEEEFIVLHWDSGSISTANNNLNSLSATARNIARMLDGGIYENIEYYKEIMSSDEWEEL